MTRYPVNSRCEAASAKATEGQACADVGEYEVVPFVSASEGVCVT